jgi:hypothetical protein
MRLGMAVHRRVEQAARIGLLVAHAQARLGLQQGIAIRAARASSL